MLKDSGDVSSVREIGNLISKKWRLRLLHTLRDDGPYRFSELKQQFEISSKVLTNCVTELVERDVIERTVQSKSHVTYSLTEAGANLLALTDELDDWSVRYRRQTVPTILVVDDDPRVNNLFAEQLTPRYDVEQASERRQLDGQQFDEVDVVVFHHKPFGAIDASSLRQAMKSTSECPMVIITSTRHRLNDVGLHHCAYLTIPVLEEELRTCIETVLDCRSFGE